ncbi:hypothetical protein NSQ26_13190 [Bacillus sp. FSL W7-1360]
MKKIYYLIPFIFGTAVVLSACGTSKSVLTEAKEALEEAKGIEMETFLTQEVKEKESLPQMNGYNQNLHNQNLYNTNFNFFNHDFEKKIHVQEERDLKTQEMYRVLRFDLSRGRSEADHEQYVMADGSTYYDYGEGWELIEHTIYQNRDYLYHIDMAYINVDVILDQMLEMTHPWLDLLGGVETKEEDGKYVVILQSIHEKVDDPKQLFSQDLELGTSTEVLVYDIEVRINAETSYVEEIMITAKEKITQGSNVYEQKLAINSKVAIVDDVNVAVPQEVLDEVGN